MANIVKEEMGPLHNRLKITVGKEDYIEDYKKEIRNYAKKANFKGFRKGKTPLSFVKKMVGRSALSNLINTKIQDELYNYLTTDEWKDKVIGQPIPARDQEMLEDFDPLNPGDYTFAFEIGLRPQFELKGLSDEYAFAKLKAEVTEEMIDEQLEDARKRHGRNVESDEDIQKEDILEVEATELEGDAHKADGHTHSFQVPVDMIAPESLQEEILGKSAGDTFRFNVYTLEKGASREHAVKHFLGLSPEEAESVGEEFEGRIKTVMRREPAELDQEFFEQLFRDREVSSEEEAREVIKESLETYYSNQAETLLFRELREHMEEQNPLELPNEFLKRYLIFTNENVSEANVEQEYERFGDMMRWSLIRERLVEEFALEVEEEEIRDAFRTNILQYFGGQGSDEMIDPLVTRFMEDRDRREEVRNEILSDKLIERLKEPFSLEEKTVSAEELDKKVEAYRQEMLKESVTQENTTAEEEE